MTPVALPKVFSREQNGIILLQSSRTDRSLFQWTLRRSMTYQEVKSIKLMAGSRYLTSHTPEKLKLDSAYNDAALFSSKTYNALMTI